MEIRKTKPLQHALEQAVRNNLLDLTIGNDIISILDTANVFADNEEIEQMQNELHEILRYADQLGFHFTPEQGIGIIGLSAFFDEDDDDIVQSDEYIAYVLNQGHNFRILEKKDFEEDLAFRTLLNMQSTEKYIKSSYEIDPYQLFAWKNNDLNEKGSMSIYPAYSAKGLTMPVFTRKKDGVEFFITPDYVFETKSWIDQCRGSVYLYSEPDPYMIASLQTSPDVTSIEICVRREDDKEFVDEYIKENLNCKPVTCSICANIPEWNEDFEEKYDTIIVDCADYCDYLAGFLALRKRQLTSTHANWIFFNTGKIVLLVHDYVLTRIAQTVYSSEQTDPPISIKKDLDEYLDHLTIKRPSQLTTLLSRDGIEKLIDEIALYK